MSLIVAFSVFVVGAPATFPISGNPPDAVTNVVNALQTAALKRGQLKSDQLMEYYVREAAKTAVNLPKKDAVRAFLLGMGRGIVDGRLGSPTMRGRADLAQHFFVSAMLTELSGPK